MKKNYGRLLMLSSLLAVVFFNSAMIEASEVQPKENTIQVSGKATIKVKPNIATINSSVETENKDAKKAQEENAGIIDRVKKELASKYKILEEDIRTIDYTVSPSYDYVEGKQVFRNYVARHTLVINVKDIEKSGEIVDDLVKSGVTSINDVSYGTKDSNETYTLALQEATKNAREKAAAIAKSIGVEKVTPISIIEQSDSMGIVREEYESMSMQADKVMGGKVTSIGKNDIEIMARVLMTFSW